MIFDVDPQAAERLIEKAAGIAALKEIAGQAGNDGKAAGNEGIHHARPARTIGMQGKSSLEDRLKNALV